MIPAESTDGPYRLAYEASTRALDDQAIVLWRAKV